MKVEQVMNKQSFVLMPGATLQQAAILISKYRVSDIMITDLSQKFFGVLSEGDIIRALMPDVDEVIRISKGKIEPAYQIFIDGASNLAKKKIDSFIIREAIVLNPSDELLKAATIMVQLNIRSLPVVQDQQLLGVVTRADLCHILVDNM